MYTHTFVDMHVHNNTYVDTHTHTKRACIHIYSYLPMHSHAYLPSHFSMLARLHTLMHVYIQAYTNTGPPDTHTHTHTHVIHKIYIHTYIHN